MESAEEAQRQRKLEIQARLDENCKFLSSYILERLRNAQREEAKKTNDDDKDVSEDYTVIDQYFTAQIAELRQKAIEWESQ